MKTKDVQARKKRTIIITGGCIALLIVTLLILGSVLKGKIGGGNTSGKTSLSGVHITPGISTDSDRVTITNSNLNAEKCIDDICISEVKITCYSNKGLVEYKIVNKGSTNASGYIRLKLGEYSAILVYENLAPNTPKTGYHGYEGESYNFTSINNYSVQAFSMEDIGFVNDGTRPFSEE